jgi:hypothetical protein
MNPPGVFFGLEDMSRGGAGLNFGDREGPIQSILFGGKSKFGYLYR